MLDTVNQFFTNQFSNVISEFNFKTILELAFIVVFLFGIYRAYIRGTQSERLLKGIGMLFGALILSKFLILLDLQIIGKFLETLVSIVIFGLVVIFQPELRRFLGYLGQPGIFSKNIFQLDNSSQNNDYNVVKEITDAIKYLSKSRTGALMVLQNTPEDSLIFEVGTKIDAVVSNELLLTIFHPNTALHDGAVIISDNRILSAGVLLPLTDDPKLSWQYGTRHRAAIGMSETSDAFCIVVSEETGNVSIAQKGELHTCEDVQEFKVRIQNYLGVSDDGESADIVMKKFKLESLFKSNKDKQTTKSE